MPPPTAIPGYALRRRVGGGGMADVYLADDLVARRPVAVKVLRDPLAGRDLRRRFEQEGKLLAAFSHPHIIPLYAAGQTQGVMYFVLKYLPDGPLSGRLAEVRTSARRVVEVVAKITSAVVYSHARGVIHRDLKPSNVLMDGDEPLVSDFGVAKWASAAEQTILGTRIGTAAYMAPEMLAKGSAATGPQADVWSVGVILYELLAGGLPFYATHETVLLELIRACPAVDLPPCPASVPGSDDKLLTILRTALAVDTRDRYPTAGALEFDLRRWLAGDPSPSPVAETG
jgi:eukaryotic-like serine/threonine-protein kinase